MRTPVLLIAIVAACGGRQRPRPADEPIVEKVAIEGNRTVSAGGVLEGLALTEARDRGEPLEPYLIAQDAERVRGYYVRQGYFAVDVTPRVWRRGDAAEITFVVDEGPRAKLARVEIVGLPDDPAVRAADLRALIELPDGAPFDYERYHDARPKVMAALDGAGYARATMKASVIADRARAEAIVRLEIDPGPVCTFGEVTLSGVEGDLADAARQRLELDRGARFSSAKLLAAQASLYDMGRFAMVRVDADRDGTATEIPVTVALTEADRRELRLGGGIGIDPASYEVHGRAAFTVAGWPTPLNTARVELRPAYTMLTTNWDSEPRLEAITSLERLDLFRPRIRGLADASFAYRTVEAYTSYGPRLHLGLRIPSRQDRATLELGWQAAYLNFRKIDPAIDDATAHDLGLDAPMMLGFYRQRLSLDVRDRPVSPRRGVYGELGLQEGGEFAAGDVRFIRVTPELRSYLGVGPLVLASRGRLGVIAGEVPVTERLFAGGASSQRGFPQRRLAPTITQEVDGVERSVPVGGAASLELGVELRATLGRVRGHDLGGALFLDGGDVTETFGELDPRNLHWAVGAGLRVLTVIGPIRLDVGYRLNRKGPGEPLAGEHFAYHLNLGEAF